MSKKDKKKNDEQETPVPSTEAAEHKVEEQVAAVMAEATGSEPVIAQPINPIPVLTLCLDFCIKHTTGDDIHEKLRKRAAECIREQEGFLRNGNRQNYRVDAEAQKSAAFEPVEGGYVFCMSTMTSRRPHDIAREGIIFLAGGIFPSVQTSKTREERQEDGTFAAVPVWDHKKKEREAFAKTLGFSEKVFKKDENDPDSKVLGKRWNLTDAKPGAKELLAAIAELVPEIFVGSAKPKRPTKVNVAILMPAKLLARKFTFPLYDPEMVTVEEYGADLTWITALYREGYSFFEATHPVAVQYLHHMEEERKRKEHEDAQKQLLLLAENPKVEESTTEEAAA